MGGSGPAFRTVDGDHVPAVSAATMAEIDRVAVDEVGLGLLQMMENAGRTLAAHAVAMADGAPVTVVAGGGGNGGGGLCAARHLANRGIDVTVVLDRPGEDLTGATRRQLEILEATSVTRADSIPESGVLVDAVIGYGLTAAPRGRAAALIEAMEERRTILALDVPSGVDATTGETPGDAVEPDRTLTLALPKTGLGGVQGELFLADIGIPAGVFERVGLSFQSPFVDADWVELQSRQKG